jgi:Protein of unknown function (DUF3606)
MNSLTKKMTPDRSKINLRSIKEMKCRAHELGVSVDRLRGVIEKVGNSAAAVKKELST